MAIHAGIVGLMMAQGACEHVCGASRLFGKDPGVKDWGVSQSSYQDMHVTISISVAMNFY